MATIGHLNAEIQGYNGTWFSYVLDNTNLKKENQTL